MSNIVPISQNLPPALAAAFGAESDNKLGASIQAGFPILSFRGSTWRIKYKGDETVIRNSEGDTVSSIRTVILDANEKLSKIFYVKNYEEGDDSPPDCWSNDGIAPDKDVVNKQCATCEACPNNVWGSKITPTGSKTKLCSDHKRIVIVPYPDMRNELYGGPMMLRVPAASLGPMGMYADKLEQAHVPYFAVVTKIAFDADASYPKFTFEYVNTITDENEAATIVELRNSEAAKRILNSSEASTAPAPQPQAAPVPTPAVVAEPPKPTPTAAPPTAVVVDSGEDSKPTVAQEAPTASADIDDVVNGLLAAD